MARWHVNRARIALAVGALGLLVLSSTPALAVPQRADAWIVSGERIVIGKDEIVSDHLYAFGTSVTIDGTVEGDLIASGSEVTINGTVEGDLMAAGQNVFVSYPILNGLGLRFQVS